MMQGVITNQRVRVLLEPSSSHWHCTKRGARKRRSVRGCIVSSDLAVMNLAIVKKGDNEIPGLTDIDRPRRLGPKRASKIAKLFSADKKDVRSLIKPRVISKAGKKDTTKAPKIQRLITPARLQRKRHCASIVRARFTKSRKEAETYNAMISKLQQASKDARAAKIAKKRSLSRKEEDTVVVKK
jgi:small subunit ribosomal protein S6e